MRCGHCGLNNAGILPSKDPDNNWGNYCEECKGYFSFVEGGRSLLSTLLQHIDEEKKNE